MALVALRGVRRFRQFCLIEVKLALEGFERGVLSGWKRGGNASDWSASEVEKGAREGKEALSVEYRLKRDEPLALYRNFSPPFRFDADDAFQLWVGSDRPRRGVQLVVDLARTEREEMMVDSYLRHRRGLDWQEWRTVTLTRRSFWHIARGVNPPNEIGCLRLILEVKSSAVMGLFDDLHLLPSISILAGPRISEQSLLNWRPKPERIAVSVTLNRKGFSYTGMPDPARLGRQCWMLKAIGVDALRMDLSWALLKPEEGTWRLEPWQERLCIIVSSGLKLKAFPLVSCRPPLVLEEASRGANSGLQGPHHAPADKLLAPQVAPSTEEVHKAVSRGAFSGVRKVYCGGLYGEPYYLGLPHLSLLVLRRECSKGF